MFGALVKLLFLVVVLGAAGLFLVYNQQVMVSVTLLPATRWTGWLGAEEVPVGALLWIGMGAGVIIMMVFAWSAWAGQRATAVIAQAQLGRAKDKLRKLQSTVKSQQAELNTLRAGQGQTAPVTSAPPATADPGEDLALEDDEDVI